MRKQRVAATFPITMPRNAIEITGGALGEMVGQLNNIAAESGPNFIPLPFLTSPISIHKKRSRQVTDLSPCNSIARAVPQKAPFRGADVMVLEVSALHRSISLQLASRRVHQEQEILLEVAGMCQITTDT